MKTVGTGAGELTLLKGIDLSLRPGELTLLMGPSGSGKTTFLSILGCILTPNVGHVSRSPACHGRDWRRKAWPPCAGSTSGSFSSPTTCSRR